MDTSHFEREVKWTKDVLQEAVSRSASMVEVLGYLGLDAVGGHHTHLSRKAAAHGIDTSHFRLRRQRTTPRVSAPEELLVRQAPENARRIENSRLRRAMLATGLPEQCAECGNPGEWLGEPLRLEVDHISGDWRDNRVENIRFLCPNCHSTTDSYRGRGKGRSRGSVS